jgi:ABC-type bacteriocin/lantibiotic exporter with double-glycine peptidase domain
MLSNQHILQSLRELAVLVKHDFNVDDLRHLEITRYYQNNELEEFKRDLVEAGNKIRILLLENKLPVKDFIQFFKDQEATVLLVSQTQTDVFPRILHFDRKHKAQAFDIQGDHILTLTDSIDDVISQHTDSGGEITFYAIFAYDNPLSNAEEGQTASPVRRLFRLLNTERKEIYYILFYAVIVGLVGLVLPLGIQNTVQLISGGVVFSSIYLLIGIVIVGVLLTGALQIVQISLVEFLQRRIFTKASLEFAFRIPRLKLESITKNYAPELINRFFDVINIQKGLPKLLIDLSSSVVQILFGLLLISLYHPFFVFFGIILLVTLVIIFYFTGKRGLDSSIMESKYKYKVVQWLEELGRALQSFKIAGSTDLPIRKTDYNVNNYLKHRKIHFTTLVTQYSFIIVFKAAITGGLLIMGTTLVINREITLGQFVASEIVIILILNAVEKIIMYMDVVYDLLTAVDKVGTVTDLPIERVGGLDFPKVDVKGFSVRTKNLTYRYQGSDKAIINNVDLDIKPGETICLAGPGSSGKRTLTNILTGMYTSFEGVVTINHLSLRDLDLTHMRDQVAKNISQEGLFDGTILENITLGKTAVSVNDALIALEQVGLSDTINSLKEGLNTPIISGGKGLSTSMAQRIILARCLAKKPKLIVLNDYFNNLSKTDKMELIALLIKPEHPWTMIAVSNDPVVMGACDRIIIMKEGSILSQGTFQELIKQELLNDFIQ